MTCADTVTEIERGTTEPVWFWFSDANDALLSLAGSRFILQLTGPNQQALLTLDTDDADPGFVIAFAQTVEPVDAPVFIADVLIWTPTLEQSRLLPIGNLTRWAIERRIGTEQEAAGRGRFAGVGGDPPDD